MDVIATTSGYDELTPPSKITPAMVTELFRTHFKPGSNAYCTPKIPPRKLRNALAEFGPSSGGGDVLGVIDNSTFGSCKSGVLFTTEGVYWLSPLGEDKRRFALPYHNLTLATTDTHIVNPGIRFEDGSYIPIYDRRNIEMIASFLNALVFVNKPEFEKHVTPKPSETSPYKHSEADEKPATIPGEIMWKKAGVHNGSVHFTCPSCSKPCVLKVALFNQSQTGVSSNDQQDRLSKTVDTIRWGKTAPGNIVAFVTAMLIGVLAAAVLGVAAPFVAAIVFMIIRKRLIYAFMKTMPVWRYRCDACDNKIAIACDGIEAAIGT